MSENKTRDLTVEETCCLQDGKCPDCKSSKILAGPEGPGSQNVLCDNCKTEFNMPFIRGVNGERFGKLKVTSEPVPIQIKNEGFIIQGRGRTDVMAIALHSCQEVFDSETEFEKKASGCVDLKLVNEKQAYLVCRNCGMRVGVPGNIRTWNDLVEYFEVTNQEN